MINEGRRERLRDTWRATFGQSGTNRRGVAVLDGGLEFKPIAMENDSAQLNETLRSLNMQIAGIFRVPPWKVGDMTNATYSNMEAGELAYITSTLDPYFEVLGTALQRDVLSTRQYGAYTITLRPVRARSQRHARRCMSRWRWDRNTGIYSHERCAKKLGRESDSGWRRIS